MQRTILLVDDEENITSALTRLLRRDGYNILRANSGKAGLELLKDNQVGVIISDQRMPEMSGTEFLTKVKDLYPDTVRIVLSGYTELNSVTDAINRGAVYKFLTKPWEEDLLRASVEEAFQRHEMTIENARLSHELQLANAALNSINLELEQRVEQKTRETVRNLSVLRVSQEILEHLPIAIVGVGDDGTIAIANKSAHLLFPAGQLLMGESAGSVIPVDLFNWAMSGIHSKEENIRSYMINGREVACWCRSMGEFSQSSGVLLVISSCLQREGYVSLTAAEEK